MRITGNVNLRHDAVITVTFSERGTKRVLDVSEVPAENVGGHLTVASITYNRLSVSGGTAWWDPRTGEPLNGIQYVLDVEDRFVLSPGQLCACDRCCPVTV